MLRRNLADTEHTIRLLNKHLNRASKEIEKEIAMMFSQYANDNKLSYAEATKLLTREEYAEWRADIESYVEMIDRTGNEKLLLELNTLSAKSRIGRLERLFYDINKILDKDYDYKAKEVKKLLEKGIERNYKSTVKGLGINKTTSVDSKEIKDILKMPWSGKNYSERIWANRDKLANVIQEEITQATIQGSDLRKVTQRVQKTMESSKRVTERLVNTEHAYACARADMEAYKEFDVDKYQYVATLDTRTSDICRELDLQVFDLKDARVGVNFPPMHPNCRSTTVPFTDDDTEKRTARGKGNKRITVGNINYKQWHKEYVESNPNYVIEEMKWKNRYSDKKQYLNMKMKGKKVPRSFDKFQNIKYNNN